MPRNSHRGPSTTHIRDGWYPCSPSGVDTRSRRRSSTPNGPSTNAADPPASVADSIISSRSSAHRPPLRCRIGAQFQGRVTRDEHGRHYLLGLLGYLETQLSPRKAGKHHAAQVNPRRIVFGVGVQVDLVDVERSVGAPVLTVESRQIKIGGGRGGCTGDSGRP